MCMNLFTMGLEIVSFFKTQRRKSMKKKIVMMFFVSWIHFSNAQPAAIIAVIKEGITKVIKAVDLKIQRLQTQTIWLQNAQKEIENVMSKVKLDEISGWV